MSLYHEAARFLTTPDTASDSLKTRIFTTKDLKNKAVHIYALIAEATKWSPILANIIERAGVLENARKLTPALALLLTHDLLIAKKGVAAPKDHVLRKTIEQHKARLSAEFTRGRVQAGCASAQEWLEMSLRKREAVAELASREGETRYGHPRWVRVNTLRSSRGRQCGSGAFAGWKELQSVSEVMSNKEGLKRKGGVYAADEHVPDLFATPPGADLVGTEAYKKGEIILQDKASCFPALMMDPMEGLPEGDIIDACAAPGNKTTHLAALISVQAGKHGGGSNGASRKRKVFAVERDGERAKTLEKMVKLAGAEDIVEILPGQDFLKLRADDARFANVSGILLDPSCSGSGIVGRDQGDDESPVQLVLPQRNAAEKMEVYAKSKKRKRETDKKLPDKALEALGIAPTGPESDESASKRLRSDEEKLQQRLKGLASFQATMLKRAMSFPRCERVVYSTCSVHGEENEAVIMDALIRDFESRDDRRGHGTAAWEPLSRAKQPDGMRRWPHRGDEQIQKKLTEKILSGNRNDALGSVADASIRCSKGTAEGTMGFFVCALTRDVDGRKVQREVQAIEHVHQKDEIDSEWEGFESE